MTLNSLILLPIQHRATVFCASKSPCSLRLLRVLLSAHFPTSLPRGSGSCWQELQNGIQRPESRLQAVRGGLGSRVKFPQSGDLFADKIVAQSPVIADGCLFLPRPYFTHWYNEGRD